MRVLQLIGSFHQGGSERQAVQLTRLLAGDGRVRVLAAALNREGVLLPEIESLGLPPVPEFPLKSFYDLNFLRQVRRCAAFLRENEVDIVHTHDFYTNIFGAAAARLAGVRVRIASKRETGGMRSPAQWRAERFALGTADRIVANSLAVRDYLVAEGVPGVKIEVVHNGLDLERLTPAEADPARIRAMFGLPSDERVRFVTLVANLRHRVKNQEMIIRAARIVAQSFPAAHFVLAGEGELRGGLEALAGSLGVADRVHFTGRCDRVPELLSISFAGVLTSTNEGFSNSILEYMAAGLPVVATRVGGAAEAVVEGETGFLVDSGDVEALAGRLAVLLDDEEAAAAFGHRGRDRAELEFSTSAQLERTLKVYGIG